MPEREFPEDLVRKISRTVLHAAERKRRTLFERLTVNNAEKLARIMQEPPVFYEGKEETPRQILLDDKIANLLFLVNFLMTQQDG